MRLISLMLILALISCKGNADLPNRILPPKIMEPALWDYMRADVYTSEFYNKDSLLNPTLQNLKLQETIFKKYKVSREQFEQSLDYYLRHPNILSPMLDSLLAQHPEEVTNRIFNKPKLTAPVKKNVKPIGIQINE